MSREWKSLLENIFWPSSPSANHFTRHIIISYRGPMTWCGPRSKINDEYTSGRLFCTLDRIAGGTWKVPSLVSLTLECSWITWKRSRCWRNELWVGQRWCESQWGCTQEAEWKMPRDEVIPEFGSVAEQAAFAIGGSNSITYHQINARYLLVSFTTQWNETTTKILYDGIGPANFGKFQPAKFEGEAISREYVKGMCNSICRNPWPFLDEAYIVMLTFSILCPDTRVQKRRSRTLNFASYHILSNTFENSMINRIEFYLNVHNSSQRRSSIIFYRRWEKK